MIQVNKDKKSPKLYHAMFDAVVVKSILLTMLKVLLAVVGYTLVLLYVVSTQTFAGTQNLGEMVMTLLLVYISFYGLFIFVPSYLFLQYRYDASTYLRPLASLYGQTLPISAELEAKRKKRFRVTWYLLLSALFLFAIVIFSAKRAPILIFLGLVPFYVMIYQNWISGLSEALGERFVQEYEADKSVYVMQGLGLLLLMHIPLVWFFQPWVLQVLAQPYYQRLLDVDESI